jgi:hypothetical protein
MLYRALSDRISSICFAFDTSRLRNSDDTGELSLELFDVRAGLLEDVRQLRLWTCDEPWRASDRQARYEDEARPEHHDADSEPAADTSSILPERPDSRHVSIGKTSRPDDTFCLTDQIGRR